MASPRFVCPCATTEHRCSRKSTPATIDRERCLPLTGRAREPGFEQASGRAAERRAPCGRKGLAAGTAVSHLVQQCHTVPVPAASILHLQGGSPSTGVDRGGQGSKGSRTGSRRVGRGLARGWAPAVRGRQGPTGVVGGVGGPSPNRGCSDLHRAARRARTQPNDWSKFGNADGPIARGGNHHAANQHIVPACGRGELVPRCAALGSGVASGRAGEAPNVIPEPGRSRFL